MANKQPKPRSRNNGNFKHPNLKQADLSEKEEQKRKRKDRERILQQMIRNRTFKILKNTEKVLAFPVTAFFVFFSKNCIFKEFFQAIVGKPKAEDQILKKLENIEKLIKENNRTK